MGHSLNAKARNIYSGALWAALTAVVHAATPAMDASVNRDRIYEGESVLLEVRVTNPKGAAEPDLSAIQDSRIRSLGSRDISQYRILWVNGQMQREGFSGRVFSYEVTPLRTGNVRIGPVRLETDGILISIPGPTVNVVGVDEESEVRVRLAASREAVLVDEPFEITLTVTMPRLPEPYQDAEPLLWDKPPHLSVPHLDQTPAELEGPDVASLLRSRLTRGREPGFAINQYRVERGLDFDAFFNLRDPFEPEPARFKLDRREVEENGKPCFEYRLAARYRPLKEGACTFGPVLFKGPLVVDVDARGGPVTKEFFAIGRAVTVRIVPPPEKGRPESYIGAIGSNLLVEARLDTQTCNVGDPLRLTLTIGGDVQLQNILPPRLNVQSNLVARFEVYENPQSARTDRGREYTFTLRPREAGFYELPPIAVSYYDVLRREYQTVHTKPLPVKVRPSEELTITQVVSQTESHQAPPARAAAADRFTPAPIRFDAKGASSQRLWPPAAWGALAAAPLYPIGIAAALWWRKRQPQRERRRRRKTALRRATRSLRQAAALENTHATEAHRRALSAIRQYLADIFNESGEALTPAEVAPRLTARGVPAALASRLATNMSIHMHAAFRPDSEPPDSSADAMAETLACLKEVERIVRRPSARASAALLLLGLLTATPAAGASLPEHAFLWEQANARMAAAQTPADFLAAAMTYRQLLDLGVRNGDVFYNMGTALLMAGRHAEAVDSLQQAERYEGSCPDIRRNLAIAFARQNKLEAPALPWTRAAFFWHFRLPASLRLWITVLGAHLLGASIGLRLLGVRRLAVALTAVGLTFLALFGSSVAATLHEEWTTARAPMLPPVIEPPH